MWVPPGQWEDAYSGTIVSGPKLLDRSEVPLSETVLYHRRPSLAVTARRIGRNAATTELRDLVIEAYPSSSLTRGAVVGTTAPVITTARELLSDGRSSSLDPHGWSDELLTMSEHASGSELALLHCGGEQRLLSLSIVEATAAVPARPPPHIALPPPTARHLCYRAD